MRYLVDAHGNVVFIREPGTAGRRIGQQSHKPSRPQIKCPYCNVTVRRSRLERHLKAVHAATETAISAMQRRFPVADSKIIASHAGDQTKSTQTSPKQNMVSGNVGTDGQDGSKHIGQFAREQGRFGSMPKYDDYSEEGSPD